MQEPSAMAFREPNVVRTILPRLDRREFFAHAGQSALTLGAAACFAPHLLADGIAADAKPESLVKILYDSLSPKQRETICFPWDHQDPKLGLLRTRVSANW